MHGSRLSNERRRTAKVVTCAAAFVVIQLGHARPGRTEGADPAASAEEATACAELIPVLLTPQGNVRVAESNADEVLWRAATEPCRRLVAANRAPRITAALRAVLDRPPPLRLDEHVTYAAVAAVCALRPGWGAAWPLRERFVPACLAALAEQESAEARAAVDRELAEAIQPFEGDLLAMTPALVETHVLVAVRLSPTMRARTVPLLAAAYDAHAGGYELLRRLLCTDEAGPPALDGATCGRYPVVAEDGWKRRRLHQRLAWRTTVAVGLAGAAVAVGVVARNNELGRVTAAGAVAAGAGLTTLAVFTQANRHSTPLGRGIATAYGLIWGAILGVSGGVVTYLATGEPGQGRAWTTAAGAALASISTLTMIWN